MASNGSTVVPADVYRHFFETFKSTVNVNDPLPVKVGSHSIHENEVDGEIVDWTLQYLQQKNCPSKLLAHLVSLILWEVRFCISKDDVDGAVNKDIKGYEPVKLMQLVTSKINNVCFEFLNNQKFESLCTELSFSNRPLHPVSVHAIRNGRRKMEDRHVVIQDLNTICSIRDDVPTSYYAVFDGHAGTDAAFYAASQLHEKLVRNSKFATEPSEALREAFLATDLAFVTEHENERLKGGTTAVVSLIRGNLLLTAWLGDSQAVLVRDGVATQLVNPHKPDRSDEKERISNLGGEVIFWDGAYRVNGQLAVSRAIGDASYKPYVTAEPDMVAVTLEGHEDFLIIGCDGLWDTIGVDEAAFIVLQYLHHETDISGLSGRLVQAAKQKGSTDNISVIVVFFREPELIARRPLPPVPTSVQTNNTPSMEQQQEEYEKLAAKWGWNEPQGGAVFDESSWQQQQPADEDGHHQQPQNPFDSSSGNPFGNGDQDGLMAEEEQDNHFYQGAHSSSEFDAVHSPSEFHAVNWQQQQQEHGDSFNGSDSAETPEVTDGLTAQWGWKDPEIEALEIEAGRDSAEQAPHFAATSVVPLPDDADIDLDAARDQYEKVAAKWGRELELVDTDVVTSESKSDFHLSSDGSTWDQTPGNSQPAGVDWNQYDEELSGQPSLIFVGQSEEPASTEQVISPIEDLISVSDMNGRAITEADRQMWASEENSVSFPPVTDPVAEDEMAEEEQEEDGDDVQQDFHREMQQAPAAAAVVDGSFVDEGIAGDEADFVVSSSSCIVDSNVADCQPDILEASEARAEAAVIPAAENDPDFHWNLHAPEFEFRPSESSPLENQQQQQQQTEVESEAAVVSSSERKLSATELLIRSSNDAQLAVLLAAANDDPDEMEPQELNISPRSDALDDIHNASNAINESKADGTVDEVEDSEDDWTFSDYRQPETTKEESVTNIETADTSSGLELEPESKTDETCVQTNCQADDLGNQLERLTVEDFESKTTIPASEQEKIVEVEAVSQSVEVEEANVPQPAALVPQPTEFVPQPTEIVSEPMAIAPEPMQIASEPVQIVSEPEEVVSQSVEIEEANVPQLKEEETPAPIQQVEETQSTVISSTVQEPEPAAAVVEAVPEVKEVDVTSTQETVEARLLESPVSDSATIGSEIPALVVTGTAIGVATAAVAAAKTKSPAAKKPIAAAKKTTTSPAKPASSPAGKPAAKEPAKKPEPTTRRVATTEAKTSSADAAKPARPTKLSPLRKATPAAPSSTTPSKVSSTAPKAAPATTRPATKPAVSAVTSTVKKTTTTTTTTTRTVTAAPPKRATSAVNGTSAASPSKTSSPAKPAGTTSTARPASAASSTPTRRVVSAPTKTSSATSRPAATSAAKTAAATTNGDVKPKPTTSATRTPTKPVANGTTTTKSIAPRPTATTTKAPAAKPATAPARSAPLKGVASRTATPGKPIAKTAAPSKPGATKTGAGTPARGGTKSATTTSLTETATTAAAPPPVPAADIDVEEVKE
ncbi:WASH complex subunit 2-like [Daphnia carinata]|uniref:WASH complex subunit 2-like n=1 Tax=Daphnia carinata TaxID=120202 RepID=UPI00257DBDC1|nr:WASH complex subunit 2-like [Daphnia carinata]